MKATELADECAKGSVEEQICRDLTESALTPIRAADELPPDGRDW
ncbi:hypothetical protein [Streptomyces pseudovenezuelae]